MSFVNMLESYVNSNSSPRSNNKLSMSRTSQPEKVLTMTMRFVLKLDTF